MSNASSDTLVGASGVDALKKLIATFDTGMLISLSGDQVQARPMAVADVASDGRITFATSIDSSKVDEVEEDARVAITFQSSARYLVVRGYAEVNRDRARIAQVWKPSMKAWFPGGQDDPSLCLLEVRPEDAESWDVSGTKGMRYLIESVRAVLQGERAQDRAGTHENIIIP